MSKKRYGAVMAVLIGLMIGAFTVSVGWGAVHIAPAQVAAVFLSKAGIETAVEVPPLQATVLWSLRLPRVILGLIVGSALAMSGVVLQGVYRNPLAEPSLLGIASGAVVGSMVAAIMGFAKKGAWPQATAGFIGALAVALILYAFFRHVPRQDVTTFVLTGVIVNVILSAVMTLLPAVFRDSGLGDTTFWTMGGLGGTMWPSVHTATPIYVGAALLLWRMASKLNVLALGDANARHLGVNTDVVRLQSTILVALVTGAAVAFAGVIAFVGLVVPHALRLIIGPDHRRLLPASALGGAILVSLSDLLARTVVSPSELPIGVFTTLAGGPLFFWLLRRART